MSRFLILVLMALICVSPIAQAEFIDFDEVTNAIAFNSDGSRAFVTTEGEFVYEVNVATRQIVEAIEIGELTYGVVVDPTDNYVYVGTNSALVKIDLADYSFQSVVNSPGGIIWDMLISPNSEQLWFITRAAASRCVVVLLADDSVVANFSVGGFSTEMAFRPDGSEMWTMNWTSKNIDAYSTADFQARRITTNDPQNPNSICFSPDGEFYYVTNGWHNYAEKKRVSNLERTGIWFIPQWVTAVWADSEKVYAASNNGNIYKDDVIAAGNDEVINIGGAPKNFQKNPGALELWIAGGNATDCVYILDISNPPVVTLNSLNGGQDLNIGDELAITWQTEAFRDIASTLVEYSIDGGNSWVEIGSVEGAASEIQWEVPDLFNLYVVVRVTATDVADVTGYDISDDWFTVGPVVLTHEFYRGWSFFSLPTVPETNTVEFLIEAGIIDQMPWDLFGFEMATSFFRPEELICGNGYALTMFQDTLSTTFNCAAHRDMVTLPMDFGWNFLGDPFPASLTMQSDIRLEWDGNLYTIADAGADSSLCVPIFYQWSAEDSLYIFSDHVDPWMSYFFLSMVEDMNMRMLPAPPNNGLVPAFDWIEISPNNEGRPVPAPLAGDDQLGGFDNWMLTIEASMDGKTDRLTSLGANAEAVDGFDAAFDYPEPPLGNVSSVVNAYFHHADWMPNFSQRFFRDIRPQMVDESDYWTLSVTNSREGEVTLSWPEIFNTTPPGYEFEIVDNLSREVIDPRSTESYTYAARAGTREFSVRVQSSLSVKNDPTIVPAGFELLSVYPNPFNSTVKVSFNLSEASEVSVNVFDINGKLVQNLMQSANNAGSHEVLWSADNQAAGLYIIRLQANSVSATQKVLLVK